jgi:DnaK suppressor protein
MAKKKENKKSASSAKKAKPAAKPVKKTAKPAQKKAGAKPTAKSNKPASKPAHPSAAKAAKPASKTAKNTDPKKMTKPVAKATAPKKEEKKIVNAKTKEVPKAGKKSSVNGKPIEAIAKKGVKGAPVAGSKKGKKGGEETDEEGDVEVRDDYEKPEEEEHAEGALDEAGLVDLEGSHPPEPDEDDDEVPEKRGRGRRKKNEGKSTGGSMEAYIRNRPLQIDINKPLIKKGGAPAPKPFVNTEDNRTRYSDKELAEFKELILEKLREAQTDYELLKQTLSNEDNHGTDDTSPSFKLLEDGSDVMSKEETAQLASRQEKYIVNLKNALVRIENKAYGICRVTGKLIPKERLRSVPHATLGIDAKLSQS